MELLLLPTMYQMKRMVKHTMTGNFKLIKSEYLQVLLKFTKKSMGLVAGLLIGLATGAGLVASAIPSEPKVPDVLRARKFELVDAKGTSRGVLGLSAHNGAYLRLNDEKGNLKAILSSTPEHQEIVQSIPAGFEHTITVSEETSLTMYDSQRSPRVVLQTEGGKVLKTGEEPEGKSWLLLCNPSGKMNATLSTVAPGEARLEFGYNTGFHDRLGETFRYVVLRGSTNKGASMDLLANGRDFLGEQPPLDGAIIHLNDKHGQAMFTTKK